MDARPESLQLDAPAILFNPAQPWLQVRAWRGPADLPALADVFRRSMTADRIDRIAGRAEWDQVQRGSAHYDPALDLQLVEAHGEVVGFLQTRWCRETSGIQIYRHFGVLVPEWRRRGLGTEMLACAHRRLREVAGRIGAGRSAYLQATAAETQQGLIVLLLSQGYAAARHTYAMVRSDLDQLPNAPLPSGIELRGARPEDYRAVWEAHEEAARDQWGHHACHPDGFQEWLEDPANQPELWQVAWEGDRVAGLAMPWVPAEENQALRRRRGRLHSLAVRRPWRRRGLGQALVVRSLDCLRDLGMDEAVAEVDVEDAFGVLRLFAGLGFRPARRSTIYRRTLHHR